MWPPPITAVGPKPAACLGSKRRHGSRWLGRERLDEASWQPCVGLLAGLSGKAGLATALEVDAALAGAFGVERARRSAHAVDAEVVAEVTAHTRHHRGRRRHPHHRRRRCTSRSCSAEMAASPPAKLSGNCGPTAPLDREMTWELRWSAVRSADAHDGRGSCSPLRASPPRGQ